MSWNLFTQRSIHTKWDAEPGAGYFGKMAASISTIRKNYVDLAAAMGYEYVLIDNWWDTNIGRERMKDFIDYAHSKKCRCIFMV